MKRLFALACAFSFATACGSDDALPDGKAVWQPCYEAFECTTIDVPVDYEAPNGPKIPLAVIRAPAPNPETRIGAIVVNPGGPGGAMVDRLVEQNTTLRLAFFRAYERFDIVAFDWRGVGKSGRLRCVPDAFFDEIRASGLTLETPADVEQVDRLRKTLTDGCRAAAGDAKMASLHTENAARDLDRIREGIGEPKLTFLGLSYGSWLGATYATMFPDRIRTAVLDAPVVLPSDNRAQIERRALTLDKALDRFFAACGADPSCAFHGGAGAPAVVAAFDALFAKVRTGELAGISLVDAALAITSTLRADAGGRGPLATALAEAEAGDASALRARADEAAGKRADSTYDGSVEGLLAVGALDLPLPRGTTSDLRTFADDLRSRSRSVRSAMIPWALAVDWPWQRRAPAPAISARSAPPMLIVSTRFDPLGVHEDASALASALGNGSPVLTYEGDGHVAVLHSDCVRGVVTDWLLDPTVPPRTTTCSP
jgi:pimeloyl-ACP methyl ester carboxylesterase